ncbi:T9SS type A sorting domain-containing protein [Flavobacterium notoginsengisoli]|uniref:T9SS type A sorting domain-containing protein n=1 Tax=Flavobacterium notoginsengisoli TaxID=1478199 RepID=UPI003631BCD6
MVKNYALKYINILFLLIVFFVNLSVARAQQSAVAVGGNSSGASGSVSFTVGEVFYTSAQNNTGSLYRGVQQPFIIDVNLGIDRPEIDLSFVVYPNPTTNFLILKAPENLNSNLNYQLFEISGKAISGNKLLSNETIIDFTNLPEAVYFLQVLEGNKAIKKFKIIKN